jgi:hypothetical protein
MSPAGQNLFAVSLQDRRSNDGGSGKRCRAQGIPAPDVGTRMRAVDMTMQPKGTLEAFALHAVGGALVCVQLQGIFVSGPTYLPMPREGL